MHEARIRAPLACHFEQVRTGFFDIAMFGARSGLSGVPVFSAGTITRSGFNADVIVFTGIDNP